MSVTDTYLTTTEEDAAACVAWAIHLSGRHGIPADLVLLRGALKEARADLALQKRALRIACGWRDSSLAYTEYRPTPGTGDEIDALIADALARAKEDK